MAYNILVNKNLIAISKIKSRYSRSWGDCSRTWWVLSRRCMLNIMQSLNRSSLGHWHAMKEWLWLWRKTFSTLCSRRIVKSCTLCGWKVRIALHAVRFSKRWGDISQTSRVLLFVLLEGVPIVCTCVHQDNTYAGYWFKYWWCNPMQWDVNLPMN